MKKPCEARGNITIGQALVLGLYVVELAVVVLVIWAAWPWR